MPQRMFVFVFSCVICIAASSSAQMNSRWQYGLKGGLSASTHDVSGDWPYKTDYRTGIDVGAFVSWRFAFSTALLMEAHYVQNGHDGIEGWDPATSEGPPAPSDFRIDYITLPFLLRIDMPVGDLPTYLLAGPYVSFKIGQNSDVKKYYEDNLESFTLGGAVGFGHQWQVGARMAVFGEALYRHDLTKAFDLNGIKLNNRAFSVLLGVKID